MSYDDTDENIMSEMEQMYKDRYQEAVSAVKACIAKGVDEYSIKTIIYEMGVDKKDIY